MYNVFHRFHQEQIMKMTAYNLLNHPEVPRASRSSHLLFGDLVNYPPTNLTVFQIPLALFLILNYLIPLIPIGSIWCFHLIGHFP